MLVYESQKDMVYALAFSADGSLLASGARDGCVMLHGLDGSAQTLVERQAGAAIHALAFHPEQPALALAGERGWSMLREADDGQWRPFGPMMTTPTMDLAFLDRATLAVGLGERLKPAPGRFELWDIRAGRKVDPFFLETHGVRAVAVCPKKKIVAWAATQRNVAVWDTRKQDPVKFSEKGNPLDIAISPDGSLLAVSSDWIVRVYDIAKKSELHMLKGHKGQVTSVAFSPDGRTLATGSRDRIVRLWDPAIGREQRVYEWPIGGITSLAYAPDGSRLAAGSDTGAVVVWDLE